MTGPRLGQALVLALCLSASSCGKRPADDTALVPELSLGGSVDGLGDLEPPPAPEEAPPPRPIEEILAEDGEDPGAVFFTSRIRAALQAGNPGFAVQLFERFKIEHPESVLLEEARILIEETEGET